MTTGPSPQAPKPYTPNDYGYDFDHLEITEDRKSALESYQSSLEAKFGSRALKVIQGQGNGKQLPLATANPRHKPINLYSAVRVIGRFVSENLPPDNISVKSQSNNWPELETEFNDLSTSSRSLQIDVNMTDEELAADLGVKGKLYQDRQDSSIFNRREPCPEDIRLNDSRKSCYLLSTLASLAATKNGKQFLRANIVQLDQEHAAVRLYDRVLGKNIIVRVSTARLLNKDKHDLYSFGNRSAALWPGIMEKAFHALKIHRVHALKDMKKSATSEELKALIQTELNELESHSGAGNLLDKTELLGAIYALPCLPERASPDSAYKQALTAPIISFDPAKDLDILRFNVEQGVPVIVGVGENIKNASKSLIKGTPAGHALAVLCTAKRKTAKGMKDGILVYDPFGDSLDTKADVTRFSEILPDSEQKRAAVQLKSGGQALQFVAFDELNSHFSKFAVVRGGYSKTISSSESTAEPESTQN
ncbi:hypothetical protein EOPP23_11150 [Endozoicomonas sp. OPT23]|uniref:hypothetical protein n=1 Tax=Endozoicomonas sp. OPT23 TaxID=2072845 RepID=UPI00129B2B46|nr:hypothetical protein [Endozoicomonas sp. OPT23]MRI33542.1 hypothetical protein [Endozoicomonas sp. OPT23]